MSHVDKGGALSPSFYLLIRETYREVRKMSKKIAIKEIDTSNLVKLNNKINWKESCEKKLPVIFKYGEVSGVFILNKYLKNDISFYYNDELIKMNLNAFRNCRYGNILYPHRKIKYNNYKYSVGDIVNLEKSNFDVINTIYINEHRGYTLKCKKCSYTFDITERNLGYRKGCQACLDHNKAIKGFNSICDINPEIASMLKNPEEGALYTIGSNVKLDWKCKKCGEIIQGVSPYMVVKQGLSCKKCSDGISFPEKFMYNILTQLGVEFQIQKRFSWCKFENYFDKDETNYGIYDFVIKHDKIIIEVDGGLGHGKTLFGTSDSLKIEESKYRDISKDRLAKEHGYKVIRINMDYYHNQYAEMCRNNIENSELNYIYNLKVIDWKDAEISSNKSLLLRACELYNEGYCTYEIKKITHMSYSTINNYLKRGTRLNLCKKINQLTLATSERIKLVCEYYNLHNELSLVDIGLHFNLSRKTISNYLIKGSEQRLCNYGNIKHGVKSLLCINTNKVYESIKYCAECSINDFGVQFNANNLATCIRKNKSYYGYNFKHIPTGTYLEYVNTDA